MTILKFTCRKGRSNRVSVISFVLIWFGIFVSWICILSSWWLISETVQISHLWVILAKPVADLRAYPDQAKAKVKIFFDLLPLILWSLPIVLWSFLLSLSLSLGVGRPYKGGAQGTPPLGQFFFHFHAVFRKNWSNSMLAHPPLGLAHPPLGNPGSATANIGVFPKWRQTFIEFSKCNKLLKHVLGQIKYLVCFPWLGGWVARCWLVSSGSRGGPRGPWPPPVPDKDYLLCTSWHFLVKNPFDP